MKIEKYTFGIGDRFAHQGRAQLQAILNAREAGIDVHPVWNKSNREHSIIKSNPDDVRVEADAAVAALGWRGAYYVDADHIGLKTVDAFHSGKRLFYSRRGGFHRQSSRSRRGRRFLEGGAPLQSARSPFRASTGPLISPRKTCAGPPANSCSPCKRRVAFTATSRKGKDARALSPKSQ